MTGPQKATINVLLFIWLALIGWDVFLAFDGSPGTTISAVMKSISHFVSVSYVFGVLAGHLFWSKTGAATEDDKRKHWYGFAIAVVIAGLFALWQTLSDDSVITWLSNNQIVAFAVIGIPCGHFLWPQYQDTEGP